MQKKKLVRFARFLFLFFYWFPATITRVDNLINCNNLDFHHKIGRKKYCRFYLLLSIVNQIRNSNWLCIALHSYATQQQYSFIIIKWNETNNIECWWKAGERACAGTVPSTPVAISQKILCSFDSRTDKIIKRRNNCSKQIWIKMDQSKLVLCFLLDILLCILWPSTSTAHKLLNIWFIEWQAGRLRGWVWGKADRRIVCINLFVNKFIVIIGWIAAHSTAIQQTTNIEIEQIYI